MKEKNFYITTTLPYVNAEPHIGFALEIIRADVIARVKKIQGYNILLNTGTDEHGMKVDRNAKALGQDTQEYVDKVSEKFRDLLSILNITGDNHFIRTTDKRHIEAAQEFWKICKNNGFIYKKNYKMNIEITGEYVEWRGKKGEGLLIVRTKKYPLNINVKNLSYIGSSKIKREGERLAKILTEDGLDKMFGYKLC